MNTHSRLTVLAADIAAANSNTKVNSLIKEYMDHSETDEVMFCIGASTFEVYSDNKNKIHYVVDDVKVSEIKFFSSIALSAYKLAA